MTKFIHFFLIFIFSSFKAHSEDLKLISKIQDGKLVITIDSKQNVKYAVQKQGNSLLFTFSEPHSISFIDLDGKNSHIFNQNNDFFDNINVSFDDKKLLLNMQYSSFKYQIDQNKVILSDFDKHVDQHIFHEIELTAASEELIDHEQEKIVFPWSIQVASAAFEREGYFWLVFNRPKSIEIEKIQKSSKIIEQIEQISNDRNTILRIKFNQKTKPKLQKNGNNWILELSNAGIITSENIKEYRSNLSAGMFFPVSSFEGLIRFADPLIGDEILVVPFNKSGIRTEESRETIDFNILETSQGFAIIQKNDKIEFKELKSGFEIISPNFTREIITSKSDSQSPKRLLPTEFSNNAYSRSIIPFKEFEQFPAEQYRQNYDKFWKELTESSEETRQAKMLFFINFLIYSQMHADAVGLLNLFTTLYPDKMHDARILLATTIAENGLNHQDKALKAVSQIDLSKLDSLEKEEVEFWQNYLTNLLNGKPTKIGFIENIGNFINTYPISLQTELGLAEISNSIDLNEFKGAEAILKLLKSIKHDKVTTNDLKFFEAILAQKQEHFEDAQDLFEELTNDIDDRKNRLRAGVELVKQKLNLKQISVPKAIEALAKLRFVWRGDENEANLLKILAALYESEGALIEALRTWKELASNLENEADLLTITSKMAKTFTRSIIENDSNKHKLDRFELVSLYYEFQELTPIGKLGDRVVRIIANELFNLDLLDQAIEILEHQLNFRSDAEEQVTIANKLALAYLLNKKSTKSLEILAKTDKNENFTYETFITKLFLKAEALLNLKKYDEAVKLVSGYSEYEALEIKIRAFILQNDLENLKATLEPYLTDEGKFLSNLSLRDSSYALQLATAYALTGEFNNLDRLYDIFKTIISEENGYKKSLEFLYTRRDKLDYQNLRESLEIERIESFINDYRNKLFSKPKL